MITFENLKFETHPNISGAFSANLDLPNGLFVSVISGDGAYSSKDTYEIAMFWQGDFIQLGAYDDVLGYQSKEQIDEILRKAQDDLVSFLSECQQRKELAKQLSSLNHG
jgi:hypothetical protein